MSASDREARPVRVDDREGVQLDPLQRLKRSRVPTHGGGGPPRPPRERDGDRRPEGEIWKHRFRVLSAVLGKQVISGDCLYLVASELEGIVGEEAAQEFKLYVTAGRLPNKYIHDFMG